MSHNSCCSVVLTAPLAMELKGSVSTNQEPASNVCRSDQRNVETDCLLRSGKIWATLLVLVLGAISVVVVAVVLIVSIDRWIVAL